MPVNVRQILSFWVLAVRPLRAEFASSLSRFGRNKHDISGPSNSLQTKKMVSWLGGLDSNQDNQIQSLDSSNANAGLSLVFNDLIFTCVALRYAP